MDERDGEEFFRNRGFGLKIGFGERPAVLSVDFINGFTDAAMPLGSDLTDEITAARRVLDAAREIGAPVIHTTVAYDDDGLADAGVWGLKQAGATTLRAGTHAVEVDERIGALPGEQLLVKKYASAFFGTDLVARLVSKGIDTVIILGCTTSGCVRASAVDAVQNGFRPIVVTEAVGDRSPQAHTQALFDLEQKYADVVPLDEVLEFLNGLPAAR
ncbi:isochorismatase family protein [Leucobacter sp. USHLN153]|uniref:isochorismatase family protein n=1 Tax=Leucobacter sp. USHLN153 TaxID=3081268 RepID=UPI0030163CCA